jgi:hypothetical protein
MEKESGGQVLSPISNKVPFFRDFRIRQDIFDSIFKV